MARGKLKEKKEQSELFQSTGKPVCVVCGELGTEIYCGLCGGPAHEACAEKVKLEARKKGNYAEVANRNAGVGKRWKFKMYRQSDSKDQVMKCSVGEQDSGRYKASGMVEDKLSIVVAGYKVDIVNIMFKAALESVGFKEEK